MFEWEKRVEEKINQKIRMRHQVGRPPDRPTCTNVHFMHKCAIHAQSVDRPPLWDLTESWGQTPGEPPQLWYLTELGSTAWSTGSLRRSTAQSNERSVPSVNREPTCFVFFSLFPINRTVWGYLGWSRICKISYIPLVICVLHHISIEKRFHVSLFTSVEVGTDVKRRCGGNFENKMIKQLWWVFCKLFHIAFFCKPTCNKYI